ncbi:hypothetical protein [Methylotuvimicrobium sp. KM1]|uniref:hypothetical protein n=1 Tax=Methylotuvimicrobium sp. KM1 TaxID=3377707 RepID=UPI00384E141D
MNIYELLIVLPRFAKEEGDHNEVMHRYLESHREAITEEFIREDVDWGLHGKDWNRRSG